jgi:hypothetical protein
VFGHDHVAADLEWFLLTHGLQLLQDMRSAAQRQCSLTTVGTESEEVEVLLPVDPDEALGHAEESNIFFLPTLRAHSLAQSGAPGGRTIFFKTIRIGVLALSSSKESCLFASTSWIPYQMLTCST